MSAVSIKRPMIAAMTAMLLLAMVGGTGMRFLSRSYQRDFAYSSEVFGNPLMGYAPCAWYETVEEDVSLLYMDITWRELEPREGFFDWETIEEENQLDRWRSEGRHIVLRFVCDIPDDQAHLDIPDWLYQRMEGDGTWYHTTYGRGFSPNYRSKIFLEFHRRAVAAMGERYGQDPLISYIELGSLGHWGEWHVKHSSGIDPLPGQKVRAQYIAHWRDAFPDTHLLMRRPFAEAKQYGLGLYNDTTGHPASTQEWFTWIMEGGEYSQTGEANALAPMPDAWKTAPIGGELTSSREMEELLVSNLEETISLVRQSHTTFLGPNAAETEYREGYDALLMSMGYRLWVSQVELTPDLMGGIQVSLTWQNRGVAPMYADWPVQLQVIDARGRMVEMVAVDLLPSDLLPGCVVTTRTTLHQISSWDDLPGYTIRLGIVDPMTGKNAVTFASEGAVHQEGALVLYPPR